MTRQVRDPDALLASPQEPTNREIVESLADTWSFTKGWIKDVETSADDADLVLFFDQTDEEVKPVTIANILSGRTLTDLKINDTSEDHQYVVTVSELTADRNINLPLLTGNDEFTFNAHTQTLTNKTLTSPDINTPDIDGGTIDGTVIGGSTPAAADFTTMDATGNATVGGTLGVTGVTTLSNRLNVTGAGGNGVPALDIDVDSGITFVAQRDASGGGTLDLGTNTAHNVDIIANGVTVLRAQPDGNALAGAGLTVTGALSKGSGSFRIDHPLKPKTHQLVHSFVESPRAENLYSGMVDLVNGKAVVNIDEHSGMTEGTYEALNHTRSWSSSNESGYSPVKCSMDGNILTIECLDPLSSDTVYFEVRGERKDKHMLDTEWTDENGKVIVEPEKVLEDVN